MVVNSKKWTNGFEIKKACKFAASLDFSAFFAQYIPTI
jgi:hypothetical protein